MGQEHLWDDSHPSRPSSILHAVDAIPPSPQSLHQKNPVVAVVIRHERISMSQKGEKRHMIEGGAVLANQGVPDSNATNRLNGPHPPTDLLEDTPVVVHGAVDDGGDEDRVVAADVGGGGGTEGAIQ